MGMNDLREVNLFWSEERRGWAVAGSRNHAH
jgi:hypothetical protein